MTGHVVSSTHRISEIAIAATDWFRPAGGGLRRLSAFDPAEIGTPGVGGLYVIGFGRRSLTCLIVGQTDNLAEEVASLRTEPSFHRFEQEGGVYVTWAETPAKGRNAIERHVAERLKPIFNCRRPSASPKVVALPPEFVGAAGELLQFSARR